MKLEKAVEDMHISGDKENLNIVHCDLAVPMNVVGKKKDLDMQLPLWLIFHEYSLFIY